MNWKDFYPFDKINEFKKMSQNLDDFSSIEDYIRHIFSQTMPPSLFPEEFNDKKIESKKKQKIDYEVFELHDFVIVRVPIDPKVKTSDLKVYHNSTQLTLKGIPEKNDKHVISLPSQVQYKKTRTKLKNNILEIIMRKKKDNRYTQIDVF